VDEAAVFIDANLIATGDKALREFISMEIGT